MAELRSKLIFGRPGATVRLAATDVAQTLSSAILVADGRNMTGAIITCESQNVRIAFGGAVPTQGTSGLGHLLYVGDGGFPAGESMLSTLRYINGTNGQNGFLQLTPLY